MTNIAALQAVLMVSVPDNTLSKALLDAELTESDTYTSDNRLIVEACAVDILKSLLTTPNISEGGYSISFDRNAIQVRLGQLTGAKPTIKGVRPW
jgi:hypothetical protein